MSIFNVMTIIAVSYKSAGTFCNFHNLNFTVTSLRNYTELVLQLHLSVTCEQFLVALLSASFKEGYVSMLLWRRAEHCKYKILLI